MTQTTETQRIVNGDVPEGLPELLTGLDGAGVAALGVKLRRYLDELPPGLLDEADRLRFPVLLLPDDVAFDDLLSAVLREVLHRRSALLERNEQVHRALMAVTLEGGGLDELVQTLANRVGALALVTTTDGRVLAGSDPEALAELTTDDGGGEAVRALAERAAPPVPEILARYPPAPRGSTRVSELMSALDSAIRDRG